MNASTNNGRTEAGEIVAKEPVAHGTDSLATHVFLLRPDLRVELNLPEDLTSGEAERLIEFIRRQIPYACETARGGVTP